MYLRNARCYAPLLFSMLVMLIFLLPSGLRVVTPSPSFSTSIPVPRPDLLNPGGETDMGQAKETLVRRVEFSSPDLIERNGLIEVEVLSSHTESPEASPAKRGPVHNDVEDLPPPVNGPVGAPALPQHIESFTLPLESTDLDVKVDRGEKNQMIYHGNIKPLGIKANPWNPNPSPSISYSEYPYPADWYEVVQGAGLNKEALRSGRVVVRIYPVRLTGPGRLEHIDSATIKVTYNSPDLPGPSRVRATYDMLIISPGSFESQFNSYGGWRDGLGVSCKVVTLAEITGGTYTPAQGRDDQEKIKYFLKWAVENWDITHVLLGGDVDYVPVRYADIPDGYDDDGSQGSDGRLVPTDLYYADIYRSNGAFCSWDSSGNDVFGEAGTDTLDLYPDVYIGRIPASSTNELSAILNKLTSYYDNIDQSGWFNDLVLAGTDTFDSSQGDTSGVAEGEYMCDFYVKSATKLKVYTLTYIDFMMIT